MSHEFDPTRRKLSAWAALALLGFSLISIAGCGGGGATPAGPSTPVPSPAPTPTPSAGDAQGVISANHGQPHMAVITAAQLSAGVGLRLDIQGNAFHSHTLTLTDTQVKQIAGKTRVSERSSTDTHSDGTTPHSHMVTFN